MGVDEPEAKRRLEARGVPRAYWSDILHFASEVRYERGSWLGGVIGLGSICAIGAGLIWGQGALSNLAIARATAAAQEAGATLIYENTGFGPLALFFGLLVAAIPLTLALERPAKKRAAAALSLIINDTSLRRTTHSIARAARDTRNSEDFLDHYYNQAWPWLVYPTLALLAVGAVLTVTETNSFYVAGPQGIEHHKQWPPYTTARYGYGDANHIELGCNHTDRDDFLIYHIAFADRTFNLGDARPLEGSLIDNLERVDASLPTTLPRKRWDWFGRDPMAPQCLARWSGSVESGPARLERLLRVSASSE